jgi:hypothetical protein
MDIAPFILLYFVVSVVLIAACLLVRSRVTHSGIRDVLGISATFIVLAGIGFIMIIGEHELG